jgi:hypothetical protein
LIFANESKYKKLAVEIDLPNIKVKPFLWGSFLRVSVGTSFSKRKGQTIVNSAKEHRYYGNIYRMEMAKY